MIWCDDYKHSTFNFAASSTDASLSPSLLGAFTSNPISSACLSLEFDSVCFSYQAHSSGSVAAFAEFIQEAIHLLQSHFKTEPSLCHYCIDHVEVR